MTLLSNSLTITFHSEELEQVDMVDIMDLQVLKVLVTKEVSLILRLWTFSH